MLKNSGKVYERYDELELAGRIDSVLSYSRGFPRVKLATGENELIHSSALGKYILPGDSLTKSPKINIITVYRPRLTFVEVTVFGHDSINYSGIVKRYQIKKP